MSRIPLAEYAKRQHAGTAKRLGMTQGSLSKAIREGRSIFVQVDPDGSIHAVEEKPFPSQRRGSSGADRHDTDGGPKGSALKVPVDPSIEAKKATA